jgi:predicted TIM-barrel fold metal-dependent hydrolase
MRDSQTPPPILGPGVVAITDSHQHLIYPERYEYAWLAAIPRLAGRAFRHDDYVAAAAGCGIQSSVFVEATGSDPSQHDETEFAQSLSFDPLSLINGIVAACRPESDGLTPFLDALRPTRVVGLRRTLLTDAVRLTQKPAFRQNLRLIGDRGFTFDLCVPAPALPAAAELAQACPGLYMVLDHCGVPDIAGGALDPWRRHITALAALPNVACKISGVLAYCDPASANRDAVVPFVEHCIEAFGWNRVLWGSDWPVVEITSSLSEWVAISRAIVAGESTENQRRLFSENAIRIYDLPGQVDADV